MSQDTLLNHNRPPSPPNTPNSLPALEPQPKKQQAKTCPSTLKKKCSTLPHPKTCCFTPKTRYLKPENRNTPPHTEITLAHRGTRSLPFCSYTRCRSPTVHTPALLASSPTTDDASLHCAQTLQLCLESFIQESSEPSDHHPNCRPARQEVPWALRVC